MVSKIEATTLLALTFLRLVLAIQYRSEMVSQRLTYFENQHFDMDVKFYGNEGYPHLTINQEISSFNDLHLVLYVKPYDKEPILLSSSPVSLCQLLHDTGDIKNKEYLSLPEAQFNLPQIFNFNGLNCPITQSTIRLSPYIFPANFTFDETLGCGTKTIEARLMECSIDALSEGKRECNTLLKNVLEANFEHNNCPKESRGGTAEMENGWIFDRITDLMRML